MLVTRFELPLRSQRKYTLRSSCSGASRHQRTMAQSVELASMTKILMAIRHCDEVDRLRGLQEVYEADTCGAVRRHWLSVASELRAKLNQVPLLLRDAQVRLLEILESMSPQEYSMYEEMKTTTTARYTSEMVYARCYGATLAAIPHRTARTRRTLLQPSSATSLHLQPDRGSTMSATAASFDTETTAESSASASGLSSPSTAIGAHMVFPSSPIESALQVSSTSVGNLRPVPLLATPTSKALSCLPSLSSQQSSQRL
jgi:hypothetical protein